MNLFGWEEGKRLQKGEGSTDRREGREGEVGDPTQFMWISVLNSSQDQSKPLVAPYGCGQAGSANKALGLPFPHQGVSVWPGSPGMRWGTTPATRRQMPNEGWVERRFQKIRVSFNQRGWHFFFFPFCKQSKNSLGEKIQSSPRILSWSFKASGALAKFKLRPAGAREKPERY